MKSHRHILTAILILTSLLSFSQKAEKFKVNFNYLLFNIPDETAYIELQFFFHGKGLTCNLTDKGTYQALIGTNISFAKEDTVIKRNYTFTSDEYQDSSKIDNIYNVVRIPLFGGKCKMKIAIFDKNAANSDTLFFDDELNIDFNRDIVAFSDVLPIGFFTQTTKSDNFTRHGIDYMPYFSNFYPENINLLTYMAEVYNSDKIVTGKDFVIHSYISYHKKNQPVAPQYERWEVAKKSDMNVVFQSFKIDSLPSGNYELKMEVKDRKDTMHAYTSYYFQRSNPSMQPLPDFRTDSLPFDTLKLYLEYIYAIADIDEQKFIASVKPEHYREVEEFFTAFWYKRNKDNPQEEWYKYYNQVMRVNYNYTTLNHKGYKTDRGFYYLKYGPPNDIEYNYSTANGAPAGINYYRGSINTPPYEIWTYNTMKDGQVNVIFVFYNPDLVTKDFRLLHSTARGEFRNEHWKEILGIGDLEYQEMTPSNNTDRRNELQRDE